MVVMNFEPDGLLRPHSTPQAPGNNNKRDDGDEFDHFSIRALAIQKLAATQSSAKAMLQ